MKKNSTRGGHFVMGLAALLLGAQLAGCSMSASFKAGGKDADEPEQKAEKDSPPPAATTAPPKADKPAESSDDNAQTKPDSTTDDGNNETATGDQTDTTPPANDAPAASSVTVKSGTLVMPGNLVFDSGAATLQAGDPNDQILGQLKAYLDANPDLTLLRVEGHTDNQGTAESNLELSGKRALAVKTWLVDHGVAAERVLAVGFGQTKPIADNSTEDGRAQNRRTEFKIAGKNGRNYLGRNPLGGGTEFK